MPRLVHLAPERLTRRIDRAGLRGQRCTVFVDGVAHELAEALFAMPVVPDFAVTHQWLRELRRWGRGKLVAVYFSIPADEPVYAGRYNSEKLHGQARKMIPVVLQKPFGAELVVPRRVARRDIHAIARIRQDIGWVETPDTPHKFDCVCAACLPSGSARLKRRIRRAYQAALLSARSAGSPDEALQALGALYLPLERAADHLAPEPLFSFSKHADPRIRASAVESLRYFRSSLVEQRLADCLADPHVSSTAVDSLVDCAGPERALGHVQRLAPELLLTLVEALRYRSGQAAIRVLNTLAASSESEISLAAISALAEDEPE